MLKTAVFSAITFLTGSACGLAQVNVSPGQTALALAQNLAGQGVIITGATLHCPFVANGIFRVVSSNLGLDSGIVLTTGRAASGGGYFGVNGYTSNLASNNNNAPGDPSLTALAGQDTKDACSLEFDVIPNGDTISFSYVFSSEEYINAVCGPYNDAFAFFISGPGIAGNENMALVPGTHIPVTINSINNGVPGSAGDIHYCTIMGAGAPFTSYYINNVPGATLTHQGFTTVLKAVHGVAPCNTYHLKMAIADAGNALYDSGVFLKAGSLRSGDYSVSAIPPAVAHTVPNDSSAFCVKGCLPGVFRVKTSRVRSQPQVVRFSAGGSAVSGIDYVPLADSVVIPANDSTTRVFINGIPTAVSGTKTIRLYIYGPLACGGGAAIADSASLYIYDTISISAITPDTAVCRNAGIMLLVNGYDFLTYNWSPSSGLSNPAIKDPVALPGANTSYTVTASIPGSGCPIKTAGIRLTIRPTPFISLPADTTVCYGTPLQLPAVVTPPSLFFSYLWSGPAGFTAAQTQPALAHVGPSNNGTYYLVATNDTNGCTDQAAIDVHVITPDTPVVASPQVFCYNGHAEMLRATGDSLVWFSTPDLDDTGSIYAPYARLDVKGLYNYYVAQKANGCPGQRAKIEVQITQCCGKLFIPNAFTPDGDGHNDVFEPVSDYGYFINSMLVFNRWGQEVYNGLKGKWDGRYGNIPAETGAYFYKIVFGCIEGGTVEKTGDVILIR